MACEVYSVANHARLQDPRRTIEAQVLFEMDTAVVFLESRLQAVHAYMNRTFSGWGVPAFFRKMKHELLFMAKHQYNFSITNQLIEKRLPVAIDLCDRFASSNGI